MATGRLPPSHAPAHGRRRREAAAPAPPSIAPPRPTARPTGPSPATSPPPGAVAEASRRPVTAPTSTSTGPGNAGSATPMSAEDHAATLVEREAEPLRARRRETELLAERADRREREGVAERRVRDHVAPTRGGEEQRGRGDERSAARALAALSRAADYLSHGHAPEAALTLRTAAERARAEASALPRGGADERALGAIASHLALRAESLQDLAPGRAEHHAERLLGLARAISSRAEALEGRGHTAEAKALFTLARDGRAQAALLTAAARETESVLGVGLVGALGTLVEASFAVRAATGSRPRADLRPDPSARAETEHRREARPSAPAAGERAREPVDAGAPPPQSAPGPRPPPVARAIGSGSAPTAPSPTTSPFEAGPSVGPGVAAPPSPRPPTAASNAGGPAPIAPAATAAPLSAVAPRDPLPRAPDPAAVPATPSSPGDPSPPRPLPAGPAGADRPAAAIDAAPLGPPETHPAATTTRTISPSASGDSNSPTAPTPNSPTAPTPNSPTAPTPNSPTAPTPNASAAPTPNAPTAPTPNASAAPAPSPSTAPGAPTGGLPPLAPDPATVTPLVGPSPSPLGSGGRPSAELGSEPRLAFLAGEPAVVDLTARTVVVTARREAPGVPRGNSSPTSGPPRPALGLSPAEPWVRPPAPPTAQPEPSSAWRRERSPALAEDHAQVRRAVDGLERALRAERRPLHDPPAHARVLPPPTGDRGAAPLGPDLARRVLEGHPLTQELWPAFRALSIALAAGGAREIELARGAVLEALRGHLPPAVAESLLAQIPREGPPRPGDLGDLTRRLGKALVRGVLAGGLPELIRGTSPNRSPSPLAAWLREAAPAPTAASLTPAERLIADLSVGRPIEPAPRRAAEGLLLGSRALAAASGAVTRYLAAPSTAAFRADPPLRALEPVAPRELAAFADPQGAVLVRTADGPVLHHGFVGAAPERLYFDLHPEAGLSRVVYRSAKSGDPVATRLELSPLARIDGDAAPARPAVAEPSDPFGGLLSALLEDEEEEEEARPRPRRRRRALDPAAAIWCAVVTFVPATGRAAFYGVVPRDAAKLTLDELARRSPGGPRALWLEFAAESRIRLREHAPATAAALESKLNAHLEAMGCVPERTAALLFLDDRLPEPSLGRGLFLPADGAPLEVLDLGPGRLTQAELVADGVLLPAAVIVD